MLSLFGRVQLCATPEMSAHQVPHSWDSPGKNTGVGCHFLPQCMKVKSESEVAQSCWTLSDPMDCSLPGSSIHRIFQARVLERGAIAFFVSLSYTPFITLRYIPAIPSLLSVSTMKRCYILSNTFSVSIEMIM